MHHYHQPTANITTNIICHLLLFYQPPLPIQLPSPHSSFITFICAQYHNHGQKRHPRATTYQSYRNRHQLPTSATYIILNFHVPSPNHHYLPVLRLTTRQHHQQQQHSSDIILTNMWVDHHHLPNTTTTSNHAPRPFFINRTTHQPDLWSLHPSANHNNH